MTLSTDYAARIRQSADRLAGLGVDRRDPHRFHETKDEVEKDLRRLANAVEIDQVFTNRPGLPASGLTDAFRAGPRTITDRKGRAIAVETRRRSAFARG